MIISCVKSGKLKKTVRYITLSPRNGFDDMQKDTGKSGSPLTPTMIRRLKGGDSICTWTGDNDGSRVYFGMVIRNDKRLPKSYARNETNIN